MIGCCLILCHIGLGPHSGFDTDAVGVGHSFGSDTKSWHNSIGLHYKKAGAATFLDTGSGKPRRRKSNSPTPTHKGMPQENAVCSLFINFPDSCPGADHTFECLSLFGRKIEKKSFIFKHWLLLETNLGID